jgi:hypothetical protein
MVKVLEKEIRVAYSQGRTAAIDYMQKHGVTTMAVKR